MYVLSKCFSIEKSIMMSNHFLFLCKFIANALGKCIVQSLPCNSFYNNYAVYLLWHPFHQDSDYNMLPA